MDSIMFYWRYMNACFPVRMLFSHSNDPIPFVFFLTNLLTRMLFTLFRLLHFPPYLLAIPPTLGDIPYPIYHPPTLPKAPYVLLLFSFRHNPPS